MLSKYSIFSTVLSKIVALTGRMEKPESRTGKETEPEPEPEPKKQKLEMFLSWECHLQ